MARRRVVLWLLIAYTEVLFAFVLLPVLLAGFLSGSGIGLEATWVVNNDEQ